MHSAKRSLVLTAIAGAVLVADLLPVAVAQPPVGTTFQQEVMKLLQGNELNEALQFSIKRVSADKDDAEARQTLETAFDYCVMREQLPVVESNFQSWVARDGQNPLAHCWLGAALVPLPDRRGEAEQEYLQALKLDPNCSDAHFRLAALRELQGKDEEAQTEWRKFLELEPDSDRAWLVGHRLVVVSVAPLTRTDGNPVEHWPTWSPDGKQIAYARNWDGPLCACRVESGEDRVIAAIAERIGSTDWSPDGRLIVTTGTTADYKVKQLFLVEPMPGAKPRLLLDAGTPTYQARWSPDGTQIMFYLQARGLHTVTTDGTGIAIVPGYRSLGGHNHLASFTADGRKVLSSATVGQAREILLWDFHEGKNRVTLTRNGAHNQTPLLRPDGQTVLFTSDLGGAPRHVRAVAVDELGRDVKVLDCFFEAEWGPYPAWSPDGRRLAVRRLLSGRIWIATLGGLDTRPLSLGTAGQAGGLMVLLTNRSQELRTVNLTYRLFNKESVQIDQGPVGKPEMPPKPQEAIECPLSLDAATQPGTYTVKLTAVTEKGERVVKLVDYLVG